MDQIAEYSVRRPPVTDRLEKNATFDMYFFLMSGGWYTYVTITTNVIMAIRLALATGLIWSYNSE